LVGVAGEFEGVHRILLSVTAMRPKSWSRCESRYCAVHCSSMS
jgi:hypothetical protein